MKKIGILTIHNVNNYGAELQACALHQYLLKIGYDSELINYHFYKNPRFISTKLSKPIFKQTLKSIIKDKLVIYRDIFKGLLNSKVNLIRNGNFKNFHNRYSEFSKEFRSIEELYNNDLNYHTVIVGSDQVWNFNNKVNIEPYFLNFIGKNTKKISYASSFGVSTFPEYSEAIYKKLLENLDTISCREENGVDLIKKLGFNATHVLDPTLLLTKEDWLMMSKLVELPYQNYILLFIFKESEYIKRKVHELSQETGFPVVRITTTASPVEKDGTVLNLTDLGPSEFLDVFSKATYVVTTSFHGSVFSVIFNKPFISITPQSKDNNARQQSFFKLLDIEKQLVTEGSNLLFKDLLNIDYPIVNSLLNIQRNKSIDFLKISIKKND